jgi:hypothetical protein
VSWNGIAPGSCARRWDFSPSASSSTKSSPVQAPPPRSYPRYVVAHCIGSRTAAEESARSVRCHSYSGLRTRSKFAFVWPASG